MLHLENWWSEIRTHEPEGTDLQSACFVHLHIHQCQRCVFAELSPLIKQVPWFFMCIPTTALTFGYSLLLSISPQRYWVDFHVARNAMRKLAKHTLKVRLSAVAYNFTLCSSLLIIMTSTAFYANYSRDSLIPKAICADAKEWNRTISCQPCCRALLTALSNELHWLNRHLTVSNNIYRAVRCTRFYSLCWLIVFANNGKQHKSNYRPYANNNRRA